MPGRLKDEEINKGIFKLVGNEYIKLEEYKGSEIKFLIRHTICGNEYKVLWHNFKKGRRCPSCSGNKKINNEIFDKKMYNLVGDEYIRLGNYKNNSTKILIRHNKCNTEYEATWNHFQENVRCPKCKESKGERKISDILSYNNIIYTAQKRFEECKNKTTLPFDFYIENNGKELLIEFDGRQHFESVNAFGGEKEFTQIKFRDSIKNKFAKENNISLLRIPYWKIDNVEEIVENKLKELGFIS